MSVNKSAAEILRRYLLPPALPAVLSLLDRHPIALHIKAPRQSKYGDYRLPRAGQAHRISINANLNPYAFLITFLHEYAHLEAYHYHGPDIAPHGREWQAHYRQIAEPFLHETFFPPGLLQCFRNHLQKGAASSSTDLELMRALKAYDSETTAYRYLEDLPDGTAFRLGNKVFQKGARSRKRYKCLNLQNKRYYMVHPLAEVFPLNSPA